MLHWAPAFALPALVLYFFFWRPWRRVRQAASWPQTPCLIVASSLQESAAESGLYTVFLTYQYGVGGRSYVGKRYSFAFSSAAAGWFGKKALVARLPVGAKAVCYVNPADPRDAVIDRDITWDMAFMAVISIISWGVSLFFFASSHR